MFKVITVEGEDELQELERFSVWTWFRGLLLERYNETTITINLFSKNTCFRVDPSGDSQYTIKPLRSEWKTRCPVVIDGCFKAKLSAFSSLQSLISTCSWSFSLGCCCCSLQTYSAGDFKFLFSCSFSNYY